MANENIAKQPNKINETYVGVYAYDMSIINDLRVRFNYTKDGKLKTNNKVQITNSENVFNIIGDIENDQIQFPIISLMRTGWALKDFKQQFQKNVGLLYGYIRNDNGERIKQVRLQALPIQIDYQVDIWTQNRIDNDILVRELIWFYKQYPQMNVIIPHGLEVEHVFNVDFENDITDNSDIGEHNSRGRYYRQTLNMYVDDAYLWKTSATNIPQITGEVSFGIYDGKVDKEMIFEENKFEDFMKTNIVTDEVDYYDKNQLIERDKYDDIISNKKK